jgi:hypothetical protein
MRKAIITAVIMALALVAIPAASASAASVSCETTGKIKLSPGLSNEPQVQNVSVKGTLTNCVPGEGEEATVTGGKYVAHLKTTEGATCAALASAAPATGTIEINWNPVKPKPKPKSKPKPPKESKNSKGTFNMPITEQPTAVSGLIESGLFEGGTIGGTVKQTYKGGSTCGVPPGGQDKSKKVNSGSLTGILTIS